MYNHFVIDNRYQQSSYYPAKQAVIIYSHKPANVIVVSRSGFTKQIDHYYPPKPLPRLWSTCLLTAQCSCIRGSQTVKSTSTALTHLLHQLCVMGSFHICVELHLPK